MKLKLLMFFLPLPFFLAAQKIKVSEDIQLKNDIAYEIIGEMKGRVLLFRNRSTDFEVQAFNENMNELWSKELELDKRLPAILGLTSSKEDFTVFYRYRRKSETVVKAHKYDPGVNLKDSVVVKNHGYLFFTPDFETIRSEDKSKVLI